MQSWIEATEQLYTLAGRLSRAAKCQRNSADNRKHYHVRIFHFQVARSACTPVMKAPIAPSTYVRV